MPLRDSIYLSYLYLLNNINELGNAAIWALFISIPATITSSLTKWTLVNSDYVRVVLVAIIIDHALGTIVHLVKRDFSILKNMTGLGLKLFIIICMGLIFEGLGTLVIIHSFIYDYLITVLHIGVFLYPAKSAMLNSHIITRGVFPPRIIVEKVSTFTNTFNIEDLDLKKNKTN